MDSSSTQIKPSLCRKSRVSQSVIILISISIWSELKKRDLTLLMKREKKWIYMLDHWDKYINQRWKTVRNRCRKGIPHSLRGHAWLYLCGGHHQIKLHPNAYDELRRQTGNEQVIDEIRKDLHRQFPTHELFAPRNGIGQTNLFNILKAFSILKPDIGYCQVKTIVFVFSELIVIRIVCRVKRQ